MYYNEQ